MTASRREPAEVRRRRILELTSERDFLRPADIAEQLDVSGETVRRDLLALERSGALRRVHGGAMAPVGVKPSEPSRLDRSTAFLPEKEEIGETVSRLVQNDDTVFFDVGTTVETAARALSPTFHGTVVTNSLAVGSLLNTRQDVELVLIGGRVRVGEMTTYGPETLAQLATFNASIAFIGSGGVDVEAGMTDYAMDDVAVKQLMIRQSARTFILAGSEKFGRRAKRFVCSLHDVDGIITDSSLDAGVLTAFQDEGVTVVTA